MFVWLLKTLQCAEIAAASVLQWGNRESWEVFGGFKCRCIQVNRIGLLYYRHLRIFFEGSCGGIDGDMRRWGREK